VAVFRKSAEIVIAICPALFRWFFPWPRCARHPSSPPMHTPAKPWWKLLTGYHWFVFIVASAAWFFDCLDQRLFSLARIPALAALMHLPRAMRRCRRLEKWSRHGSSSDGESAGMIFGALGDKYGRAKMLMLTILIYSGFTGLSFSACIRSISRSSVF